MAVAPVASPSRPSVRFTAFVVAVVMRFDQITNRMTPIAGPAKARSSHGTSRAKEIAVEAGVRPRSSGKFRARTAKAVPIRAWRMILPRGVRPSERCFVIFVKSSTNPTKAMPTVSSSRIRPEAVGPPKSTPSTASSPCVIRYASTRDPMMTAPPIVGVPRLVLWVVGPSSRTNWPYPRLTRNRMNSGVPAAERTRPSTPPMSSPITVGTPSGRRRGRRRRRPWRGARRGPRARRRWRT